MENIILQPWNNSAILPPPVNMSASNSKVDVAALEHVCNNIMRVLSKQSPLHKESAICSRFLYKYDSKFRNDIGYRNLKKVNTALRKYLKLNLLKDVDYFLSALPSNSDDEMYLPTRQMLEYVLVRIITFSKIMFRICVCSKQAAVFYLHRIKRGDSHWMSLLPYALLCRLWSMCMVLIQHSCSWYSNLHPYLKKLQLKGLNFLPDNYSLPADLEQWLELNDIDKCGKFVWAEKKFIRVDATLIDDDDGDMLENIFNYVKQTDEVVSDSTETDNLFGKMDNSSQLPLTLMSQVDQGEVLSRETFKVLNTQNRTAIDSTKHETITDKKEKCIDYGKVLPRESLKVLNKKKVVGLSNMHLHHAVTNGESLKNFIKIEEGLRNKLDDKSLTSHMSFMQWEALKKCLLKLCNAITDRNIERKFQKLWKEKCLDCM